MALILAVNPGNSHTPILSRLARELQGCELIGAESCAVAINAIKERLPDVVLLPAKQARGEADLVAYLKTIPGGVLTLQMPSVDKADPADLAAQIRALLTGAPATPSDVTIFGGSTPIDEAPAASPHLLSAASAAINWIRARRAQWGDATPGSFAPEHVEPYEPYEPIEATEPYEPYAAEETHETSAPRASYAPLIKAWLPRVAALAAVVAVAGALVSYWPHIRGGVSGTVAQINAPREASPQVEEKPKPAVTQPAEKRDVDPLSKVSGWVAVFAPFELSMSEAGRGVQLDERGRAMLAPGRHRLRLQNRELGYDETRVVDVKPADTITINVLAETAIAVTSSEPAEVVIDGTRVGDTPYNGKIGLGTHTVTVRTAGAERQLTVGATSKPVRLEVDFSKP